MTLSERGELGAARTQVAKLDRLIDDLRQPSQIWLMEALHAMLALAFGDFAEGEMWVAREMDSTFSVTPARDDVAAARMHQFLLRREQGRIADVEPSIRASVDDFPWYPLFRAALACLLLDLDRVDEARVQFDILAQDDFQAIYPDNEWLFGMALASDACARLHDSASAAILYGRLLPYAGRHAVGHAEGSLGAVDRYLGLLAAMLGRLDAAVDHLGQAIDLNDATGARSWRAHCQHDLASVLRRRGAPGDRELAARLDATARQTALETGMALADRIASGDGPQTGPPTTALASATFRREGEYWSIEFDAEAFRLRDSKGMRHLAELLGAPGREVHSLELAGLGRSAKQGISQLQDSLTTNPMGDAGPGLDAEAKAAYRERLMEIRRDLAQAEDWNDPERVALLHAEEHALGRERAAAVGGGGRDRPSASPAERARVSVTRAIRASMGRIREQSRPLGDHLEATIRTGTFCSYVPDPRAPIDWHT
jgi:tetratricopeptide (TPR) repeat protein